MQCSWIISEVGGVRLSRTVVNSGCHCRQKQSYSPWGTPSYTPYTYVPPQTVWFLAGA